MTVIHGKKSHNRLMSEACESFNADIIQINNLYELLLKEIENKATKKSYRDLYNKSYLTEIKEKEEKFKKEKNRVNLNTATLINTNYWRIEGIRSIYTVFYKNVSEVFGKDVEEFEIPEEVDDDTLETESSNSKAIQSKDVDEKTEKISEVKMPFKIKEITEESFEDLSDNVSDDEIMDKYKSIKNEIDASEKDDKNSEESNEISEEDDDSLDIIDNVVEEFSEEPTEEFDIFGEKYRDIAFPENDIIPKKIKESRKSKTTSEKVEKTQEETEKKDEDNEEDDEESLLDTVKTIKRKSKKEDGIEDVELTEDATAKKGLLKKMRKITNVKKFADDIW